MHCLVKFFQILYNKVYLTYVTLIILKYIYIFLRFHDYELCIGCFLFQNFGGPWAVRPHHEVQRTLFGQLQHAHRKFEAKVVHGKAVLDPFTHLFKRILPRVRILIGVPSMG